MSELWADAVTGLDEQMRELSLALNRLWDEIAVTFFVPIARRLGLKVKPRYELAARRKAKRDAGQEKKPSL